MKLTLLLLCTLLCAGSSFAQSDAADSHSTYRIEPVVGIVIGPSWSNMTGDFTAKDRTAMSIGGFGRLPLLRNWYLRGGAVYAQHGYRSAFQTAGFHLEKFFVEAVSQKLDVSYLEVSGVLGYAHSLAPLELFLEAGPFFALKVADQVSQTIERFTSADGVTFDRTETRTSQAVGNLRAWDAGAKAAGGVLYGFRRTLLGVAASYNLGVVDTFIDVKPPFETGKRIIADPETGRAPEGKNYRLEVSIMIAFSLR